LPLGRRADSGDPFPGRTDRTTFNTELAGGVQLTGIELVDGVVRAEMKTGIQHRALVASPEVLRITALTGATPVPQRVNVRSTGAKRIDWVPVATASWIDTERDGDALVITADPRGLAAGTYTDTVDIRDISRMTLAQVIVSFYVAAPGVGQIIATELPWSWGVAVSSGRILQRSEERRVGKEWRSRW